MSLTQSELTLNLVLELHKDDGHADDGGLHGGHLSLEQGLLCCGAGHCRARDLLGVGGDLGTLGEGVGDFYD